MIATWRTPRRVGYKGVHHYNIYWRIPGFFEQKKSVVCRNVFCTEILEELEPGKRYEVRVVAVAANGVEGDSSNRVTQRTGRRRNIGVSVF